jgi:hypothetical protein
VFLGIGLDAWPSRTGIMLLQPPAVIFPGLGRS